MALIENAHTDCGCGYEVNDVASIPDLCDHGNPLTGDAESVRQAARDEFEQNALLSPPEWIE